MGYTTRISDYENERATTRGPEVEGYDVEAEREALVTKSKVVEVEEKSEPEVSEAKTKDL